MADLQVFDVLGRRVYGKQANAGRNQEFRFTIDIPDWPGGLYFVRVISADGTGVLNATVTVQR